MAEQQKGTINYTDQFGTRRPDLKTKEQSMDLARSFLRYATGRELRHEMLPHKQEGRCGFEVKAAMPGVVCSVVFEGPMEDVSPISLFVQVALGTEHADAAFFESCRLYNNY
jgi:hypothetical protein